MRALGYAVLVGLPILSSCAGGSMNSTATETDSAATTASDSTIIGTNGMSATSSTSTSPASSATDETDGDTESATTTGGECHPLDPGRCDVWAQDDCCEGEKCSPWAGDGGAWNTTRCVPVDPEPDAVGEPCTVVIRDGSQLDSCEKGAMCWNVDSSTNVGVCYRLCGGVLRECLQDLAGCCPDGFTCAIYANAALNLCLQVCDPLAQDCLGGEVCYPVDYTFHCAPDLSDDMGAAGDPCTILNLCDPGTFCGTPVAYPGCDPNAGGCCIPFCPLDLPECALGTDCVPWYDPMDAPPGYENLGACTVPP